MLVGLSMAHIYEDLPDDSKEAFLLGQFLEVLKLFWEVGGALVFLHRRMEITTSKKWIFKNAGFWWKKNDFYLVGDDEEKGTKEHVGGKDLNDDKIGQL